MDKKILVNKIRQVIDSFAQENKQFSFVGLTPVYPEFDNTSYILSVKANWLTPQSGIAIVTKRLFDLLDKKTLRYINRVEVGDVNTPFEAENTEGVFDNRLTNVSNFTHSLMPTNALSMRII